MTNNKFKIIKNFLEPNFFENLKGNILNLEFPWYRRKRQVFTKDKLEIGYFTHSFYNKL